jgi:hypothetical protein
MPRIFCEYENDEDPTVYKRLTLSNDGVFFHYSICECGTERFTKGKWRMQNGYLYLESFANFFYDIYPKVNYVYGTESDSIDIYFTDYFSQPVSGSLLCFKYEDTFKQDNFSEIYLGETGHVKLSKKVYYGFMIKYETHSSKPGEVLGHYFEDRNIDRINIVSEFNASFDRRLIKEDLGNIKYETKGKCLYSVGGDFSYKKINPFDDNKKVQLKE